MPTNKKGRISASPSIVLCGDGQEIIGTANNLLEQNPLEQKRAFMFLI